MTLGKIIQEYREANDMSQRQFAERCGLSNAYISILEKNESPKTKEAPVPTIAVFKVIADEIGIPVHELMEKANETKVSMGQKMQLSPLRKQIRDDVIAILNERIDHESPENELLELFRTMTKSDQDKLLDYARYIVDSYKRPDKRK